MTKAVKDLMCVGLCIIVITEE